MRFLAVPRTLKSLAELGNLVLPTVTFVPLGAGRFEWYVDSNEAAVIIEPGTPRDALARFLPENAA